MEWLTGNGAGCSTMAGAEAGLLHEAGNGRGRGGSSDGGHGAHSHGDGLNFAPSKLGTNLRRVSGDGLCAAIANPRGELRKIKASDGGREVAMVWHRVDRASSRRTRAAANQRATRRHVAETGWPPAVIGGRAALVWVCAKERGGVCLASSNLGLMIVLFGDFGWSNPLAL